MMDGGDVSKTALQTTVRTGDRGAPNADPLQKADIKARLFGETQTRNIGRFKLLERLGEGGMGVVYAAAHQDIV
jgi:hypothetical protein